jgi:hypothetical protein
MRNIERAWPEDDGWFGISLEEAVVRNNPGQKFKKVGLKNTSEIQTQLKRGNKTYLLSRLEAYMIYSEGLLRTNIDPSQRKRNT